MSKVRDEVVGAIAREAGIDPDEIRDGADLAEDLGIDSLDIIEAVVELEDVFDTDVPDEIIDGWRTIDDVVGYFEAAVR